MCAYQPVLKGVVEPPPTAGHFNPLNLGRLFLNRSLRMYGVALETDVEKGVVRRLAEIADNIGAVIRFIQVSLDEAAPSAKAIAFLDFSDSDVPPEKALEIVKKLEFVKHTHIMYPSSSEVLFDNYFFPLTVGHSRAVVFDKTVYESLFKGIREEFGSAGEAILYYQGFNVGFNAISLLEKATGSENNTELLIELVKIYTRVLGWGIIENVKIDFKREQAKIRLNYCFECEIGKGYGKPYSQFYRGYIAGIFSKIFQKRTTVQETKCIAKGDPHCEFKVRTTNNSKT